MFITNPTEKMTNYFHLRQNCDARNEKKMKMLLLCEVLQLSSHLAAKKNEGHAHFEGVQEVWGYNKRRENWEEDPPFFANALQLLATLKFCKPSVFVRTNIRKFCGFQNSIFFCGGRKCFRGQFSFCYQKKIVEMIWFVMWCTNFEIFEVALMQSWFEAFHETFGGHAKKSRLAAHPNFCSVFLSTSFTLRWVLKFMHWGRINPKSFAFLGKPLAQIYRS